MTYQQRIASIVPSANARHVEALMRTEYGSLDSISAFTFVKECHICAAAANEDPDLAEQIARSYGL